MTGRLKAIRNIPETPADNSCKSVKEKTCVARGNPWNPSRETVNRRGANHRQGRAPHRADGPRRILSFLSLAGHGGEGDGEECGLLKTRLGAPEQDEALGVLLAQGQGQPPSEGE